MIAWPEEEDTLDFLYPDEVRSDTLAARICIDFILEATVQSRSFDLFHEALRSTCIARVEYGLENGYGFMYANLDQGHVHVCNSLDKPIFGMYAFPNAQVALAALAAFEEKWSDYSMIDFITECGDDSWDPELPNQWDDFLQQYGGGRHNPGFCLIDQDDFITSTANNATD